MSVSSSTSNFFSTIDQWETGDHYTKHLMKKFADIEMGGLPEINWANDAAINNSNASSNNISTNNNSLVVNALLLDGYIINKSSRQILNTVVNIGIQGLGIIPSMIYDFAMTIFHLYHRNQTKACNHIFYSFLATPFRALLTSAKDVVYSLGFTLQTLIYNAFLIIAIVPTAIYYGGSYLYQRFKSS